MAITRNPGVGARAARWCVAAAIGCTFAGAALAATVTEKARESGCVNKPIVISGTMYRCVTESGAFS